MAALFLPPEDDGVAVRYVIDMAAEDKYATWLAGLLPPARFPAAKPACHATAYPVVGATEAGDRPSGPGA